MIIDLLSRPNDENQHVSIYPYFPVKKLVYINAFYIFARIMFVCFMVSNKSRLIATNI